MACERPVLITDVADNKYWVSPYTNECCFKKSNHNELAEKIIYLYNNPKLRAKIGKHLNGITKEKNTIHTEMKKSTDLYHQLIKKR